MQVARFPSKPITRNNKQIAVRGKSVSSLILGVPRRILIYSVILLILSSLSLLIFNSFMAICLQKINQYHYSKRFWLHFFNYYYQGQSFVNTALLQIALTSLLEEKWTRTPPAIALPADPRIVSHPHMYFRFTHKILSSQVA